MTSPCIRRRDDVQISRHALVPGRRGACAGPDVDDESQHRNESRRGRGTLAFVPWAQMTSHIINLGKQEMDVYIPG